MGEGDLVCGLEPAIRQPDGRTRAVGEWEYIQPGEVREFYLELLIEGALTPNPQECIQLCL